MPWRPEADPSVVTVVYRSVYFPRLYSLSAQQFRERVLDLVQLGCQAHRFKLKGKLFRCVGRICVLVEKRQQCEIEASFAGIKLTTRNRHESVLKCLDS